MVYMDVKLMSSDAEMLPNKVPAGPVMLYMLTGLLGL